MNKSSGDVAECALSYGDALAVGAATRCRPECHMCCVQKPLTEKRVVIRCSDLLSFFFLEMVGERERPHRAIFSTLHRLTRKLGAMSIWRCMSKNCDRSGSTSACGARAKKDAARDRRHRRTWEGRALLAVSALVCETHG